MPVVENGWADGHVNSLGESTKEVRKFLLVAQQMHFHMVRATLRKAAVILGDRLAVAPVTPGYAPLVADALREGLFTALGQLRLCRPTKPTPKCPP